jgi:hypothetical protein
VPGQRIWRPRRPGRCKDIVVRALPGPTRPVVRPAGPSRVSSPGAHRWGSPHLTPECSAIRSRSRSRWRWRWRWRWRSGPCGCSAYERVGSGYGPNRCRDDSSPSVNTRGRRRRFRHRPLAMHSVAMVVRLGYQCPQGPRSSAATLVSISCTFKSTSSTTTTSRSIISDTAAPLGKSLSILRRL